MYPTLGWTAGTHRRGSNTRPHGCAMVVGFKGGGHSHGTSVDCTSSVGLCFSGSALIGIGCLGVVDL